MILLRNVMIYFSQETRRDLLARIRRVMAPDGFLFLGSAEQPPDGFVWTPMLSGGTCYYRQLRLKLASGRGTEPTVRG